MISPVAGLVASLGPGSIALYLLLRPDGALSGVAEAMNEVSALAILFLFFDLIPAALTAVVTGHFGLVVAKRIQHGSDGRGIAVSGLALGYLGLVLGCLGLLAYGVYFVSFMLLLGFWGDSLAIVTCPVVPYFSSM